MVGRYEQGKSVKEGLEGQTKRVPTSRGAIWKGSSPLSLANNSILLSQVSQKVVHRFKMRAGGNEEDSENVRKAKETR